MKIKTILISAFVMLSVSAHAGFMAVANVSKIHGKAFINKEAIKEGAEIADHMIISIPKPKDYIEVKFQNGHIVRFTGATVKVEDLTPKATLFNLIRGKVFAAIKPLTQGETFQVKTVRASFGVRGTHFMVEETKKQSYLCVCEGVVAAKSKKGEVDVKKDEDFKLAKATDELKSTVAAQSMIESTNATFKEMGVL